ncbi:MAG: hypothetical protein MR278_01805 [Bacteroidales bacterium]|nr:hypothetical protein [Anaerotignum sp.]MCI5678710.1 hypothetical protein [Bacteroidales bacterium]MDY3925930.1 hypothetical protein [Anaerotignum sp.]
MGAKIEALTGMPLSGYSYGIAYATGGITEENGIKYLRIRNQDKSYPDCIAAEIGGNVFQSHYHEKIGKNLQYVLKARQIKALPPPENIPDKAGFCRAYIEIHGLLDLRNAKNGSGNRIKALRLRIYGNETILQFINQQLPAKPKKLQRIKKENGETSAIYFQGKAEIKNIFQWIDGTPKNQKIWDKWNEIL